MDIKGPVYRNAVYNDDKCLVRAARVKSIVCVIDPNKIASAVDVYGEYKVIKAIASRKPLPTIHKSKAIITITQVFEQEFSAESPTKAKKLAAQWQPVAGRGGNVIKTKRAYESRIYHSGATIDADKRSDS
jgi:hypothetical protein